MSNISSQYQQAIEWLYNATPQFQRIGAAAYKPGLETARTLAAAFDNPQRAFRSIHIAGTNGKGSTAHSLAAILQSQGYKVGLYTSPHLVDFRERMRIDGRMIDREDVIDFIDRFRSLNLDISPSFFELTTIMAFDWFARSEVDFAVIETGLGGRLDTTNIITPILSVITNISKDHTAQLGNTLAAIAREKAGIIKPGVPTVIGSDRGEGVSEVFDRAAATAGAPIYRASDIVTTRLIDVSDTYRCYDTKGYGIVDFSLAGDYQDENFKTILAAVKVLVDDCDIKIDNRAVVDGLRSVQRLTSLAGRWTIVSDSPRVVCDTGHNEGAWRLLSSRLAAEGDRLAVVIGFVNDKDVSTILSLMPPRARYYFTQASVPRAMPAITLASLAANAGLEGEVVETVAEAVARARQWASAGEDRSVFVGGSTFVVADLLASL